MRREFFRTAIAALMLTACWPSPTRAVEDEQAGAAGTTKDDGAGTSTDGQAPTLRFTVQEAPDGSCASLSVEGGEAVETCHGWVVTGCSGVVVATQHGVRRDRGIIHFTRQKPTPAQRSVEDLLAADLSQREGPEYEFLHLAIEPGECTVSGMDVPFTGSYIRRKAEGSATGWKGKLSIDEAGNVTVVAKEER